MAKLLLNVEDKRNTRKIKSLHPFAKWDSNPELNIRDIESRKHHVLPAELLSLCHSKVFCLLSQIILLHLACLYSQLWVHNNTVRCYPNLFSDYVLFKPATCFGPKGHYQALCTLQLCRQCPCQSAVTHKTQVDVIQQYRFSIFSLALLILFFR